MYCPNCGKKLADDALFCDECGTKIVRGDSLSNIPPKEVQKEGQAPAVEKTLEPQQNIERPVEKKPIKEGQIHKCPRCGELIPFDAVNCPTCGYEIRDRGVAVSVQEFFDTLQTISDEEKKIDYIKTYPIPNTREDILEFMLLAKSNYDAKYYATNKNIDSLSSAWLSKIEQCYTKAKIILREQRDLDTVEEIYKGIKTETKKVQTSKLVMIIAGLVSIVVSLILIVTFNVEGNTALGIAFIALLAVGIVLTVFGFKKKKTNKQIADEKAAKGAKKK